MGTNQTSRTAADNLLQCDIDLRADGKAVGFLRQPHSVHRSAYGWIPTPIARIARGRGDRPRLATNDRAEVERLSTERLPLYRSIADVVIDTRAPERDCVTRLAALLNSPRWPWPSSRASG